MNEEKKEEEQEEEGEGFIYASGRRRGTVRSLDQARAVHARSRARQAGSIRYARPQISSMLHAHTRICENPAPLSVNISKRALSRPTLTAGLAHVLFCISDASFWGYTLT